MKVLFATSEAQPFAASGGLADVSGALPKALRTRFVGCRVIMPLYDSISAELREKMTFIGSISVPVSWRRQYCGIFEAKSDGVIYYLLDNQYYFKRGTLYGHYDDAERFAFFSRAVLEVLPVIDFKPDIIHCNDWQTALIPVYKDLFYAERPEYSGIKTIFTIHNIQYQGIYSMEILGDVFGIPDSAADIVKYRDCVNLMKGAIERADRITTVSPTYAQEIMDPWYSHELDGILKERSWKLSGIVNGIDTDLYNPETDPMIYQNYSVDTREAKAENKRQLQRYFELPEEADIPLIGMVTRLVSHKGLDLVKARLEAILDFGVQVVVLGSGEFEYENFLYELAARYPDKLKLKLGFIPDLAHKIYAGADIFLMPSKSEPCGLAQMVALRYGTIPVVRATGGLRDTITDSGAFDGNGFVFQQYNADDMAHSVYRAVEGFKNREGWNILVERAMRCDNSWAASANEYIKLYKSIL
ncbi:MAG: glycogen synthase GlgA [Clostridia bacterium]|nr:glycogen synthase GlgA [Clostridia bacterium]MBQ9958219.1 glycogen synthase GlgA [Clostridia bacterium]